MAHRAFDLRIPQSAKALCVQNHRGRLVLWAMVSGGDEVARRGRIELTGAHFEPPDMADLTLDYFGSVQFNAGDCVAHVFLEAGLL